MATATVTVLLLCVRRFALLIAIASVGNLSLVLAGCIIAVVDSIDLLLRKQKDDHIERTQILREQQKNSRAIEQQHTQHTTKATHTANNKATEQ